jgi:RHS repeat-associated protein
MKKAYLMFGILLVFGAARTFADNAFTGQSSDASHAYYLRARYYDPETGIFLTKDPMGVSAGLNSYQYVFNNPVNSADPLGLFGFWDYTAQVGSYVGGTIVAIAGVSATAAGAATSEIGVGVPIVAGGLYLTAQGGSSMVASGRNLWYMILNPSATEVPLTHISQISFTSRS